MSLQIDKYANQLRDFGEKWKVRELALFGSGLRDDFGSASDVDLLVSFKSDADWSLLDHVVMQEELESLFQRNVDLVNRRGLERSQNYIRKNEIINTAKVIYAAA